MSYLLSLLVAVVPVASGPGDQGHDPQAYLVDALRQTDPNRLEVVLAALSATGDKELAAPLGVLARGGDPQCKQLAMRALVRVLGKDAAPVMLERLKGDLSVQVRRQALGHLIALDAISADDLTEALGADDERIRCLAACALAQQGQILQTADVLQDLSGSADPATANLARIALLMLGHTDQLAPIGQVLCGADTGELLKQLMLEQIQRGKVSPAAELVERVARTGSKALRLRAYMAYAAISPKASATMREAIGKSPDLVFRTQVLAILADCDDARVHLEAIAAHDDALGLMARFELARTDGGQKAAQAVAAAMKLGHPIVVDGILRRARQDIDADREAAGFYTEALLDYIRSVEPNAPRPETEHHLAATAAGILADLDTPAAMAGLKEILSRRYSTITRVVTAGLLQSQNRAVCSLARPFLASPYEQPATNAALVLGYFADPEAAAKLRAILNRPTSRDPGLGVLVSWYLLKIDGQAQNAADALARQIR